MSRSEFEEKNRRLLMGDGFLREAEIYAWEEGRDWLAHRATLLNEGKGNSKRRTPRLQISIPAYIAGMGRAVTDDLGFGGMRLVVEKPSRVAQGDDASVRLNVAGRSIYVLGRVVWFKRDRLGLALRAAHPDDERALQATVCSGLLDHWDS